MYHLESYEDVPWQFCYLFSQSNQAAFCSYQVMYHLESYEDVLQLFRSYAEVIAAKAQARVLIACCATLTHALRTGCASCAEATTLAAATRLPPCC